MEYQEPEFFFKNQPGVIPGLGFTKFCPFRPEHHAGYAATPPGGNVAGQEIQVCLKFAQFLLDDHNIMAVAFFRKFFQEGIAFSPSVTWNKTIGIRRFIGNAAIHRFRTAGT